MTRKQSQQHDAQRKPSWRVRWKTMSRAVGMEIREHKSSFAVYVVLRMLVLAMAILQFFNGDYENVFLCILTLLLLLAPAFIQVQFRIELPSVLEVIVLVNDPEFLILDEPFVDLDPDGVLQLIAVLRQWASDRSIAMLISSCRSCASDSCSSKAAGLRTKTSISRRRDAGDAPGISPASISISLLFARRSHG